MTDSDDKPEPPPQDSSRTVFMPASALPLSGGGSGSAPPGSPPPSAPPGSGAAENAWPSGQDAVPQGPSTPPQPPPSWADSPPASSSAAHAPSSPPPEEDLWGSPSPRPAAAYVRADPAPPTAEGRIAIGMVLNHIYEVRRFLARGGMGEVYEGCNVNTDERVAIKVILSHLAMDPNVQAMFRKEARTLTRLSHPALVQYRVLAQEPTLGVLYIVTEFIDGAQLSDVIGKVSPDAAELEQLTRRLASGLQAAHELGAIHRDISPDNVLLPGGRLGEAKVIDFGIAKDLDPTNKTIVGDGFAGKLGFVAPEQFGDYDREIGPWTDIYSLALVILSVAAGKPVDMGATLVDAIDKRRAGPDLSVLPERLRPVFAGMLKPNPAERFRSMAEVLAALDQSAGAGAAAAAAASTHAASDAPRKSAKGPPVALIAGAVAVVVIGGAAAVFLTRGSKPTPAASGTTAAATAAGGVRDSEKVRRAVEAALPGIACTWIDIDDVNDSGGGVSLRLSGVAGSPVAAQQAVSKAAQATGAKLGLVDTSNVFPVGAQTCAPLDTFRAFREPSSEQGRRFVSQQSNWELMEKNDPCMGPNAKAVVDLRIGDPSKDFSVVGMDRNGGLQQIFASRAAFNDFHKVLPDFITDKGGDSYSSIACYNETGLVGELLLTGQGPFDVDLPNAMKTDKSKPVDAAWLSRFSDSAKAKGWKTNMVWYRVVNDQPG